MQGFAYSAITEEEIDAFLAGQGVPKTAIQKLPFDLKKRIYLEKPRRNPTLKGATSKGGVEIFTKLGKRNCLYSYLIFEFCQSKIANVYLGMEILPGTYAYR